MRGFSLLEIMVVLVIIAIVMSMVVPNIIGKPDEARITAAKADLRTIVTALDIYKLDNFVYPTTQQGLESLVTKPSLSPQPQHWKEGCLKKLPTDPWGNPYQYYLQVPTVPMTSIRWVKMEIQNSQIQRRS